MHRLIVVSFFAFSEFTCRVSSDESLWSSTLRQELQIPVMKLPSNPIYRPNYRYDNNERNVSAEYDLWDRAGFYLFEWPGNITMMDPNFPLLKWEHPRARLLRSPCGMERGLELAAYAYKYLHLTWGANHLTKSYCNPLRVNRKKLPEVEQAYKSTEIGIVDFDFIFDGFLVVTKLGNIIRFTNIEINYRTSTTRSHRNLTYSLPTGIETRVNRVLGQKCCSKTKLSCPHGDAVLAYQEMSPALEVFISYNGGESFERVKLRSLQHSNFLYGALWYPNWMRIVAVHGDENTVLVTEHTTPNGDLVQSEKKVSIQKKGYLQVARVGNEMEFVIWDDCTIWYAHRGKSGIRTTPAVFYLHNSILKHIGEVKNDSNAQHIIRSQHCYFGRTSSFQIGDEGKLGFLDKNNLFFYGVDLKRNDFRVVGLTTDLSLLLPEKKNSIVLDFDRNNRPKLSYPPRYLRLPTKNLMDSDYKKRLGMRIVPKTLFPSDFMEPFFEENLRKVFSRNQRRWALSKCQTSSLSIDGSVSQKPKSYTLSSDSVLSFYITFESISGFTGDLKFDPVLATSFLNIRKTLIQTEEVDINQWYRYNVNITLKSNYLDIFKDQEIFLVNFYTIKSLRCVHQPVFPVWIKIDTKFKPSESKNAQYKDYKMQKKKPVTCAMEGQNANIEHCPLQSELDRQNGIVCPKVTSLKR
ncbi:unnamed protein product [Allacma fusca]|uniref:Uncharacterized protein n=1 Tax=Allacma fusca TaxID=39272 RepID=A0A8J2LNL6_9HEXA|nr:unnamed protein product [Allacma fusca]